MAIPQKEEIEEIGHYIAEKASDLSNLMSGSTGRDKICALVQYTVQFYSLCMRHSDEMWIEESEYVKVSERIVENISSGRKIFKFLKFLEPLRKIHEYHTEENRKPVLIKILKTISFVCTFFLYLSDNILWLANMGIIKKIFFQKVKWKRFKDFFALWKNIVEIIKQSFEQLRNLKKQHDVQVRMSQIENEKILPKSEAHELVRKLIILRKKLRFTLIGIIQNILRTVMLLFRLKMPYMHEIFHPIFISQCGMLSSYLGILKLFKEKKQFVKLKKLDQKNQPGKDSQIVAELRDGNIQFYDDNDDEEVDRNIYYMTADIPQEQIDQQYKSIKQSLQLSQQMELGMPKSQFLRHQDSFELDDFDSNIMNSNNLGSNQRDQQDQQRFSSINSFGQESQKSSHQPINMKSKSYQRPREGDDSNLSSQNYKDSNQQKLQYKNFDSYEDSEENSQMRYFEYKPNPQLKRNVNDNELEDQSSSQITDSQYLQDQENNMASFQNSLPDLRLNSRVQSFMPLSQPADLQFNNKKFQAYASRQNLIKNPQQNQLISQFDDINKDIMSVDDEEIKEQQLVEEQNQDDQDFKSNNFSSKDSDIDKNEQDQYNNDSRIQYYLNNDDNQFDSESEDGDQINHQNNNYLQNQDSQQFQNQMMEENEEEEDKVYDKRAMDPKYNLFSLRRNSTINYLGLMRMDQPMVNISSDNLQQYQQQSMEDNSIMRRGSQSMNDIINAD
eukprot:403358829